MTDNDYDIDKLIEIVMRPPEKPTEPNEAQKFVAKYNVKRGHTKVYFSTIYDLYRKDNPTHTNRVVFGTQLAELYKKHRDANGPFYYLNPEPFGMNGNDEKENTTTE